MSSMWDGRYAYFNTCLAQDYLNAILTIAEKGVFLLDESLRRIFSAPIDGVEQYIKTWSGSSDVFKTVSDQIAKLSPDRILVNKEMLDIAVGEGWKAQTMDEELQLRVQMIQPQLTLESGYARDQDDFHVASRNLALSVAIMQVRDASSQTDLHAIQKIMLIDDLDRIINALYLRLREWYGLHFPELERIITNPVQYSEGIIKEPDRKHLQSDIPSEVPSNVRTAAAESKGAPLLEKDRKPLVSLAREVVSLTDLRSGLADGLEDTMKLLAPNLTSILGSPLAARLLARAGSLRRLASLTSGAIQVLGAEKALFRAMRSGGKPPKHGIIFQHNAIRTAARWQRGRMARYLAGRIALAARIDAYRGELEPSILIDLQSKIESVKARASDRKSPPNGVPRKRFKHGERQS